MLLPLARRSFWLMKNRQRRSMLPAIGFWLFLEQGNLAFSVVGSSICRAYPTSCKLLS